jgi:predicted GTPase
MLVANKVDDWQTRQCMPPSSMQFGLGEVYCISGQRRGTGELLDDLVKSFTKPTEEEEDDLPKHRHRGKAQRGEELVGEHPVRQGAEHRYP